MSSEYASYYWKLIVFEWKEYRLTNINRFHFTDIFWEAGDVNDRLHNRFLPGWLDAAWLHLCKTRNERGSPLGEVLWSNVAQQDEHPNI